MNTRTYMYVTLLLAKRGGRSECWFMLNTNTENTEDAGRRPYYSILPLVKGYDDN